MKDDDRGVLVNTVVAAGPCAKALKAGDVLVAIDDHPIASDGNVELEGERVEMPEVVERKFKGDKVKLDIIRDKTASSATVELDTVKPYLIQGHTYDVRPRYVVYGGLLFQPLNLELIEAYQPSDLRLRHFFDFFVLDQIYLEHPEVIVLTNILPDPINTYLAPYRGNIVDEVNGKKIRTLDDLAKALAEPADRFVINMIGDGPPLMLDPKQVGRGARADQDALQRHQGTESGRTAAGATPPPAAGTEELICDASSSLLIAVSLGVAGSGCGQKRSGGSQRPERHAARPKSFRSCASMSLASPTIIFGRGKKRRRSPSAGSARFSRRAACWSRPIW